MNKKFNRPIEILLVEDNAADIRLTEEALKESKVCSNLCTVTDGAEAINFLNKQLSIKESQLPDLILLDLNIPKKNGKEVLERIKNDDDLKKIPVVVLTTSNSEADIFKTYDLHANCFITKPADFNYFIDVIRSVVDFWLKVVSLPSRL